MGNFSPAVSDNKTKLHFRALDEAIDVDSKAYCWRRSGFFWRMRASLGLALGSENASGKTCGAWPQRTSCYAGLNTQSAIAHL